MIDAKQFYGDIEDNIAKSGRQLMGIFGNPPFVYSIGMHLRNLPEILCIGMSGSDGMIANLWCDMMLEYGREFHNGELVDIGGKYPCMALQTRDPRAKTEFTLQATEFFGHDDYRVTQMLIPDHTGKFGLQSSVPFRDWPILGSFNH